jgi:iron(III) transport system permease protein
MLSAREERPGWRRVLAERCETFLPLGSILLGVILVLAPLLATLVQSVVPAADQPGVITFAHFMGLAASSNFLEATLNTLFCGVFVTVLSTALGFVLAWLVSRTDMPGRRWFELLNLVPFFLSPYVGALSWIYLAAPHSGLIQNLARLLFGFDLVLPDIFGRGGVIMILTLFYTPYIYLFVIGPLRQMDGALEDAARVSGASFLQSVRRIVVPLMMPALLSAALIVFVTSAGLFDVPLALASPSGIRTIPTEIFGLLQYPTDFGRASAVAVIILAVTVVLTVLQRGYIDKRRFDTVSGKGYRPRRLELSGPARAAALAVEVAYVGAAVVLPITALALVSFSTIWTGMFRMAGATLRNYQFILFNSDLARHAIQNSLILALVGATVTVVISLLQAYGLQRGAGRWRVAMDTVLSLSLGIPGIILGLGMLIIAVRTPLYSTLSLILIAYIVRFFPYSTRNLTAMLMTINPELEQSARTSGASWLQATRHILLPLMWPGIVAAWIMLFVILIRELGATILIYARGTETISVALVLLGARNTGYVAALGIIQVLLLLAALLLLRLTRARLIPGDDEAS